MHLKPFKFFFLVILAAIILPMQSASADVDQKATISLQGTGSVSVAPDMAIISFGVTQEAKTAREALDQNNKAMGEILSAMRENGVEEKDLQTSGFNVSPRYVYPKRKTNGEQPAPQITGYLVSNQLTVRIRDINKVGGILDLSVTLGMNSGGNIQFTNANTKDIIKQARTRAVEDALEKAQTLATAANVKLGNILNINENSSRHRPVAIAQARSLSVQESAAVPIASGENSYKVNVQMTWEILQ